MTGDKSIIGKVFVSDNPYKEKEYVIVEDIEYTRGHKGWIKYRFINRKKIENPLEFPSSIIFQEESLSHSLTEHDFNYLYVFYRDQPQFQDIPKKPRSNNMKNIIGDLQVNED
jgi:hypothetical protein